MAVIRVKFTNSKYNFTTEVRETNGIKKIEKTFIGEEFNRSPYDRNYQKCIGVEIIRKTKIEQPKKE